MSENDIQTLIDRSVKAGKESQKKDSLTKIIIGVSISVLSVAIITFFTSFYGVANGVKNVTSEYIEFKKDTEEDIESLEKSIDEVEKDVANNSDVNFQQEGAIQYLKGKSERGIAVNKEKHD